MENINRLKLLRAQKDLTVRKLAELTGLSSKTVSFIENGRQKTTLNNLVKLANALEVDVKELADLLDTTASERGKRGQAAYRAKLAEQSSPKLQAVLG